MLERRWLVDETCSRAAAEATQSSVRRLFLTKRDSRCAQNGKPATSPNQCAPASTELFEYSPERTTRKWKTSSQTSHPRCRRRRPLSLPRRAFCSSRRPAIADADARPRRPRRPIPSRWFPDRAAPSRRAAFSETGKCRVRVIRSRCRAGPHWLRWKRSPWATSSRPPPSAGRGCASGESAIRSWCCRPRRRVGL